MIIFCFVWYFFFFKQKTAYEMLRSLVGSEMCIRDRGVDDRPLERRLQAHLDLEEVRPLADLEAHTPAVGPDADAAGAGDDLAGDEERGQAVSYTHLRAHET